jgi:signal transduction histidine kinase/ActR/RegA family two-component response regulator
MSALLQTVSSNLVPIGDPTDRTLRRAHVLELVYEVTRAINSSLNLDEVTEFIYQGFRRILPADNFYIAIVGKNQQVEFLLEVEDRQRRPMRSRPMAAGLTEYLLGTRRPLMIPRNFERSCRGLGISFVGRPAACWMGAPMVFRDRAVGVIATQSYDREEIYDAEHLSVLENLASQAAAAIENARLFQELKDSYQDLQATQQRLLQSEKLAAVGQLISGVAHELNNPLTGVVGWSQYLLGQTLPSSVRTHVATINEQAQRATRIVQNLLTFSRQHKPEKSSVSLSEVVEKTLALRSYELRVNNIQVHNRLEPQLRAIHADAHQIQQVILNLIINAEQAILGARGGGNLTIEARPAPTGVLLSVSDDGPGIAPDQLKKIFDPFFTTKPVGQGTGLGLSISYGIIEEHGGRIWVESKSPAAEGSGATFYIWLPWEAEQQPASVTSEAQTAAGPTSRRILIVDDEESVRDLFGAVLEQDPLTVDMAATGEEGLEMALRDEYDLVITDLKMPGLGGSSFYDHLSEQLRDKTPRFIFMTGDVLNAETQHLLDRTRSQCILKPFDIHQARAAIHRCLAEKAPAAKAVSATAGTP